jgi:hypothetical protein
MARGVVEPGATPAGQLAKVEMPATAMTDRTLEPWTADAFHGLVPHDRIGFPSTRRLGRAAKQTAFIFTPLQLRHRGFGQGAALEQVPNVQSCVRLD